MARGNMKDRSQTSAPTMHHVGYVVASIQAVGEKFARSVGGTWDGRIWSDPIQRVKVSFVRGPMPSDPQIELVEPDGEGSPVTAVLKRGGGLNHVCYEVDDLEAELGKRRAEGSLIIKAPVPAVAFDNRRIAWFITPERLLMEYLER